MATALATAMVGLTGTLDAQTPAPKPDAKATMDAFQLPSHGALLNAFVYIAAGEGPHPVVVLLHGFPGNEKNLDVAQAIRRAGWNVLYFDYRGSWGSPGDFSLSNSVEDTAAAVAYLRQPEHAKRLRVDPARIVLIGHSMGGFMTVQATAADPGIMAFGLISAADMRGRLKLPLTDDPSVHAHLANWAEGLGMAPLAGCTPETLAREIIAHAAEWDFNPHAPAMKGRPGIVITSDDGLAPYDDSFAAALRAAGDTQVTTLHLVTDHSYSDKRLELTDAIVKWLGGLAGAPR